MNTSHDNIYLLHSEQRHMDIIKSVSNDSFTCSSNVVYI